MDEDKRGECSLVAVAKPFLDWQYLNLQNENESLKKEIIDLKFSKLISLDSSQLLTNYNGCSGFWRLLLDYYYVVKCNCKCCTLAFTIEWSKLDVINNALNYHDKTIEECKLSHSLNKLLKHLEIDIEFTVFKSPLQLTKNTVLGDNMEIMENFCIILNNTNYKNKKKFIELCSLAEKFNNEILEEYLVKPEVEVLNILFEKLLSS